MAIAPIGISAQATGAVTTQANGQMGKMDFLKLLVAQMRYQDPLEPMKDSEFVAQMAQFSSLEQLLNLNGSFSSLQSVSYLGRTVKAYGADGGVIEGVVKGVTMTDEMPVLKFEDGTIIAMKDVFEVQ